MLEGVGKARRLLRSRSSQLRRIAGMNNVVELKARSGFTVEDLRALYRRYPTGHAIVAEDALSALWVHQGVTVITYEAVKRLYVRWHQGEPTQTGATLAEVLA
jgi:hypothetical protein